MREVAAEFANPVMLYSIAKDSSVMLHLAMKAFYPAKPPFPLLHVDTTWKFREMIQFRDETVKRLGLKLLVHLNEEGIARGINPFDSGSALYTQVMKTEALKQALDKYGFDAAFGGAGATRKNRAPRNASSPFALRRMPGIRRTSGQSFGASTTPASTRASRSASFRSPTGPNSTSGSTSWPNRLRTCHSTSRRTVPSSSETEPSRRPTTSGETDPGRETARSAGALSTLGCYPWTGVI